jgi:hypothetical protein
LNCLVAPHKISSVTPATEKLLFGVVVTTITEVVKMKSDVHLAKARRIEESFRKLDLVTDWEMIIEGVYGAALHYIAYITEAKMGIHHETHKGLPKFLDENGLSKLAELFRTLELLRQSRWYGGKENGEVSKEALFILERIKQEGKI